jgi:hypothetical protein
MTYLAGIIVVVLYDVCMGVGRVGKMREIAAISTALPWRGGGRGRSQIFLSRVGLI